VVSEFFFFSVSSCVFQICAMAKRLNRLIHELGPDIDLFVLEFAVNDCTCCISSHPSDRNGNTHPRTPIVAPEPVF
jgi:hypothetical protein